MANTRSGGKWPDAAHVCKEADACKDHTNNELVKKFNEITDGVIAGWTMVIPFGGSFTSNLDE